VQQPRALQMLVRDLEGDDDDDDGDAGSEGSWETASGEELHSIILLWVVVAGAPVLAGLGCDDALWLFTQHARVDLQVLQASRVPALCTHVCSSLLAAAVTHAHTCFLTPQL
jgi:hypothetical protein